MYNKPRLTLSLSNILLIVVTGLVVVLLWQLQGLLVTLMIAVVLAAAISPLIDIAERLLIPRWLAVILVYLGFIALFTGAGVVIGPKVIAQIELLIGSLPGYLETLRVTIENLAVNWGITDAESLRQILNIQALTSWVIGSSQQVLVRSYGFTKGILGAAFNIILAVLFSGYMLADSHNLIKNLISLFPYPWDERLAAQVKPVTQRMGGYIQARVLVSAIMGIAISFGLGILGMPEFALGLGAIAGVTNLIPFIGSIIGTLPALVVAIAHGGWLFVWVLLLFLIVQNVEAYVLNPLLVGSSVKLHPLYLILAVLGGTEVLGIVGALIVPPWVAGAAVLLENLYLHPKLSGEKATLPEPLTENFVEPQKSDSSKIGAGIE